ncbi:MAG TPA: ABC transporter ATP-binding protein [Actinomycetota bacterium]|nr:ABC transporter ATP-binding protein [Actinomycetota bacterium]
MTVTGPLLEVRGLRVTFAGRVGLGAGLLGRGGSEARAVDGVDLSIDPGEVVALAGESGCGKTTLARTILGLERPRGGQILFEGAPIGRDGMRGYRRKVQMVFQDPAGALNPRQTIYESVAEGLRVHRIHDEEERRVAGALSSAGLRPPERFFLRYPHELSGGQRQRVVIAGALVLEPKLIVADEPVSMLDASVRGEILSLLLRLRQELGLALLVATHDLGLAWSVADRVAVMYLGKIVEVGPAEDVLTRPLHPYTQALLEVAPGPSGDASERPVLAGEPPDPTRIPPGCRFHPRCPVVASGRAAALGLEERNRTEIPELVELRSGHFAACHVAAAAGATGSPGGPTPPRRAAG